MNHHYIAQIFDVGATPDGTPFFTMEYVDGEPITEWCKSHQKSINQRLRLFIQLCEGVLHFHQKAVVHRDLKPTNILITLSDGKPVVKIIDFGIARDLGGSMYKKTYETQAGDVVGTPAYMSPEQLGYGEGVDTRCDVYALGVILYELLTDLPPIDPESISQLPWDMVLATFREEVPPKPSDRLGRLGEEHQKKSRNIRGDLDWITMKAMEKDVSQRYNAVGDLRDDIRAYLANLPIMARAPKASYRIKKFILRYKTFVASTVAIILALLVGLIFVLDARDTAVKAEKQANELNAYLSQIFAAADARQSGKEAKVIDLLEFAKRLINDDMPPSLAAGLHMTLARTYMSLGEANEAIGHSDASMTIVDSPRVDPILRFEAITLNANIIGRKEGEKAEDMLRDILKTPPSDTPDELLSQAWYELGEILKRNEKYDEAMTYFDRALTFQKSVDTNAPFMLRIKSGLASLYRLNGQQNKSMAMFKEVIQAQQNHPLLGPNHPETIATMSNYARNLSKINRPDLAEPVIRKVWQSRIELLGENSSLTLKARSDLARRLVEQEKYEEAQTHALGAWENYRLTVGPTSSRTMEALDAYILAQTENNLELEREVISISGDDDYQSDWRSYLLIQLYNRMKSIGLVDTTSNLFSEVISHDVKTKDTSVLDLFAKFHHHEGHKRQALIYYKLLLDHSKPESKVYLEAKKAIEELR